MVVSRARGIRDDGWYFLATNPSAPSARETEYERVLDVAEETTRSLGGTPQASQWIPTDKGWVGRLSAVANPDSALAWLERFAVSWADGTVIQPRPRKRISRHRDPSPTLTLGVAYRTEDLTRLPLDDRGRTWAVSAEVTRELVHHASAWLDVGEATSFYRHTPWSTPTVGFPPPRSVVEAVYDANTTTILRSMRTKPVRHRAIEFEREGRIACQDVDSTRSAQDHLTVLLECARWQPADIDYAFITFQHGGSQNVWMGDYAHYDLPNGLTEPDLRGHRPLLSSYVPDAFAVQILTDAHLERAHDLGDWEIEEVLPGRHLVIARDLAPWLVTPAPHPENEYRLSPPPAQLIDKARADFGDMILTREVMEELDPL